MDMRLFLAQNREWHAPDTAGLTLREYKTHRQGGGEALHPYLRRFESCVLQGQAVYRSCEKLKQEVGTRLDHQSCRFRKRSLPQ